MRIGKKVTSVSMHAKLLACSILNDHSQLAQCKCWYLSLIASIINPKYKNFAGLSAGQRKSDAGESGEWDDTCW